MRHLCKAFHALRMQKTLVIVLASEIVLKGDGDCKSAFTADAPQITEMRTGWGAKLPKKTNCRAAKVICQSASTTWCLLFLSLTKHECLFAWQSTTISAHLQTQRANTSFIGNLRATCRKKKRSWWLDSSDHDLGRDIENASHSAKIGKRRIVKKDKKAQNISRSFSYSDIRNLLKYSPYPHLERVA